MPPPVVYVVAIITGMAAAIVFKEYVYEPHIAPKLERWAEEFIAKRRAKRRQREGGIVVTIRRTDDRRKGDGTGRPDRPHGGNDDGHNDTSAIELEKLVAAEVNEWRSEVDRSRSGLTKRRKKSGCVLEEVDADLPYPPLTPTHVIFDPSSPPTPTDSVVDIPASPHPPGIHHSSSVHAPIAPPMFLAPESSSDTVNASISTQIARSPQANPDLFDVVSVSSQPDSIFTSVSEPRSLLQIPLSLSQIELLSASDDDMDRFSVVSSALSSAQDGVSDMGSGSDEGLSVSGESSLSSH